MRIVKALKFDFDDEEDDDTSEETPVLPTSNNIGEATAAGMLNPNNIDGNDAESQDLNIAQIDGTDTRDLEDTSPLLMPRPCRRRDNPLRMAPDPGLVEDENNSGGAVVFRILRLIAGAKRKQSSLEEPPSVPGTPLLTDTAARTHHIPSENKEASWSAPQDPEVFNITLDGSSTPPFENLLSPAPEGNLPSSPDAPRCEYWTPPPISEW